MTPTGARSAQGEKGVVVKKIILVGGAVLVVLVLALAGFAAYLLHSINTPQFKQTLLQHARATVGADVKVEKMDVSIFSGVTLSGVVIANPRPFPGSFLTADSFVLRYRLLPLLSGRLEVQRLALEKPRVDLVMDAKGNFNYEKLGPTQASPGRGASPAAPAGGPTGGGAALASPIELQLKQLAVHDASIVMKDQTPVPLMKVENADLDSSLELTAGGLHGSGRASIGTLDLADVMFVRGISSPIEISKQTLVLSPIRGKLAGGELTGDVNVNLAGGFRFTAELELKGASVDTLLQEAHSARAVTGSLTARASFEGAGGLPTMKGKGHAEIADCKLSNVKVLALLAAVLRVPELANPDFDQCRVEFKMTGSRVQTPVVSLEGKQIQLAGAGTYNLDSSAINYNLTLALAQPLFAKVTARELRAAFKERGDGFWTVDFAVTGTSTAPRTDLATRVGKAVVGQAAKKELGRLFGRR